MYDFYRLWNIFGIHCIKFLEGTCRKGFRFYANDHKPVHIHVEKSGAKAKVQIEPAITLLNNEGFSPRAIKLILALCEEAQELIIDAWEAYHD